MVSSILLILLGYVAGSVPTGVLLARRAGIDVRMEGSGNVGATNVARTAGRRLGILTLAGDLLKGLVPVAVARGVGASPETVAAVAIAAIVGHVFSLFLRFHGGKGVATGFGVLVGLAPLASLLPLLVFVIVVGLTRIVSLASIFAAGSAPVFLWLMDGPLPVVVAAAIIAFLITWRHQENIARLLAGTESRFRART
ncbi:MAG: glycerol-3-phosphate 1-O-acyltransferase PlsY [Candidatus Binatia bacterium]